MKQRIWELDVFRGICILGMVVVHFVYDLIDLYHLVSWDYPGIIRFAMDWGGILFVILSGICATLGRKSVRRGLIVLGAGMIVTAVTYGMYHFGFADKIIVIYFGVLHCLGICMLLWWLFKRLPTWALAVLAIGIVALGFYVDTLPPVDVYYLMPLGLPWKSFATSDYFPLLPYLGWFLLGSVIGRTAYRRKTTLLPLVNPENPIIRFFSFCGRQSLWIYLLHQPILSGILTLVTLIK
jgi:uncharacterized membrane protein